MTDARLSRYIVNHDHANHAEDIADKEMMIKLKEGVLKDPTKGTKRVYNEVAKDEMRNSNDVSETVAKIPTYKRVARTMQRQKSKLLPPEPTSLELINLTGDWLETNNKEQFLAINDGTTDRIVVYATKEFAIRMAKADILFCDGTFKSVPKLFKQLYTFHAKYDKQMIPLVYCLLPSKSAATYMRLLNLLRDWISSFGFTLSPKEIMVDYEQAMITTIRRVFPNTRVRGCLFHYTQCIYRHVQSCGLSVEYLHSIGNDESNNVEADFKKVVRRFLALPFLPLTELEDAHTEIMEDIDLNDQRVSAFSDYHLDNWFKDGSTYPRELWNQYRNFCDRTNNGVEGWHSAFNKAVGKSHPRLYQFIDIIKDQQLEFELVSRQVDNGESTVTLRRKYITLNDRIKNLTAILDWICRC
ncbi:uncharacterized protein B4U80_09036 [Leptotrombidium deliense]|uniref:MULE transposase domain-containing protein n=1 Tax=Leptotrombidium deliense TaxID=299467 RepID=A0A443S5C6_9ACAR|nr:uncharacterized protein B4U80_09036 [Leptotrombidium deliense]